MSRVALVTGGAKGIGKSIVEKLVNNNIKVVFSYFSSEVQALELVKKLNSNGNLNCIAIKSDARSFSDTQQLIEECVKVFGKIDILINNAGIAHYGLLMDMQPSEWQNVIESNLNSVFYTSKLCIPYMLNDGGNIINISSVWGIYGASMEVCYSATKAGVIGFTKALAQELGRANIRVNCIAPGVIDTDMNKNHSEQTMNELKENTPLAKIGKPEDIANAVEFLISDKASFITGQVIEVTGGFK